MPTTLERAAKAAVTVFSPGSTSAVTSGNNALSAAIDFSQANTSVAGYAAGFWTIAGTLGGVPTANTGYTIYLYPSCDGGTTYDTDPGRSTAPVKPQHATIPAAAADNSAFVRSSPVVEAPPPVNCKVLLMNNGTGQQINTGWALYWTPVTDQGN